jgi:nucleoside-diphosphate-sugar epimerase
MVNLFGKGFIGGRYFDKYFNECFVNDRNDYTVYENDVLYFISTVDNYNIHTNPHLDIDTNLTTLIKVLESFRKKNPTGTFNFISSWFVYGETDLPAREDSPCNPKGFYSITKRTAEQLLIHYCETFRLNYRILRLPNVLGETDNKVSQKKNVVQYMLKKIQNDEPIQLYQGGHILRDYMYVDDICDAIHTILEKGNINEIYNIASGEAISLRECMEYAIKKSGSKSTIEDTNMENYTKVIPKTNRIIDNTKLAQLGFLPKYSVYDTIDILLSKNPTN